MFSKFSSNFNTEMLKNPMINGSVDDFKFKDFVAMEDFLSQEEALRSTNFGEQQVLYERSRLVELPDSSSLSNEADSHESSEVCPDLVLDYIDRMLMEENMDDKFDMSHPALVAAEKPFYEIIGEEYPASFHLPLYSSSSTESFESHPSDSFHTSAVTGISDFGDNDPNPAYAELLQSQIYSSQPPIFSELDGASFLVGLEDHQVDFSDLFFKTLPTSQFEKGVEEAKKFLPSEVRLVADSLPIKVDFPIEPNADQVSSNGEARRQKSRPDINFDLEEQRSIKHSAISYEEPPISSEMFDTVLLCNDKFPKIITAIREAMQSEVSTKNSPATIKPREPVDRRKLRGRKKQPKEVIDLQTLLIQCAQTISSGNHHGAHELLRQIRQHSSPYGDSTERVAHYFADGLEARLAGTGSDIYHALVSKRKTAGDVLKAYQLYLAACPFKNVSYYFSNQTIFDAIKNVTRVHILDFGIYFGFQWPSFMKMLSDRPGGPPKLRITGIDVSLPGFRPAERIEETGRRLSHYAERFGIPFEYQAVASKLDQVKVEDLRLDEEEMLIVNCLFRMNCLGDESMGEDCPRDKFLNNTRKLNPALFVNVSANGSYGAPFFVTRFREALYHFSSMFDMLEMTVPREHEQRLLVERDIYGKFAINVVSCEGAERVERPETYKQTQVRCLRAGLRQLPINSELAKKVKCGVKAYYHKDFSIDEGDGWLLQGWRGRIFVALSTWKPRY